MAAASWRRHFSMEDGLDKYPALQIKRPQFDDRQKRHVHSSNLKHSDSRTAPSRSGYLSDGSSSGFHTNRSRDLSEEIHLPNRIRASNDVISDISGSRYHGGDELNSEERSNAPYKAIKDWKSKYESKHYNGAYQLPEYSSDHSRKGRNRREEYWGFMKTDDQFSSIAPSVKTSTSITDIDGTGSSASGSLFVPRHKNARVSPNRRLPSTLESNSRRKGKRARSDGESPNGTRTSGYCSNNTYSEMSDFTNYHKSNDPRKFKPLPVPNKQDGGDVNQGSDTDTLSALRSRSEHYQRRSSSTLDDRTPRSMYSRSISANESDISLSSKDRSSKSTEKEKRGSTQSLESRGHSVDTKTQKVPAIGNVSVTVTNNIQYDPNDPFSFIQPIDLPFHKKVRKCMGPIVAILLLLILAAALGAAIYFASELNETQEKQIDLLRANLAMRIRNTDIIPNIENLSSQDLNNISRTYCKQMDIFYAKSEFKETYRGCEVISFKNSYLNFTLFFVEKEATSSEIIGVIESSAEKVTNASQTFALVDKFELELEDVRVTMERRLEPETFNKKTLPDPVPTVTPAPDVKQRTIQTPKTTSATERTTKMHIKDVPKDKPVYSWTPCEDGYNGTYFPHPTDCAKFFHCSNKISIERNCTKGNLYLWQEFTCVSRFTPNIQCPDASKAPPKPTPKPPPKSTTKTTRRPSRRPSRRPGTKSTKTTTTTAAMETTEDLFYDDFYDEPISETTLPTTTPKKPLKTALAGRYPGRPSYTATPCKTGADGRLYAHPDDCARFIQCVNGREMIMNCSGGLVFNPKDRTCIFPPNPELVCPDIQPCKNKATGYFSHPFDCTKFIQCQSNKEKVLSCRKGLVWSPRVNSCIHDPKSPLCHGKSTR